MSRRAVYGDAVLACIVAGSGACLNSYASAADAQPPCRSSCWSFMSIKSTAVLRVVAIAERTSVARPVPPCRRIPRWDRFLGPVVALQARYAFRYGMTLSVRTDTLSNTE